MSALAERFFLWLPNSPRRQLAIVWGLYHLPVWLAVPLAEYLKKFPPHDATERVCVPCHAAAIIKNAKHAYTVGPQSDYCHKCGIDYVKWPKHCANKVKKVNNPARRRGWQDILSSVFWE